MSRRRKVSWKAFKFAAKLMNEHLTFPAAKNRLYVDCHINQCLLQLSLGEDYAESGLANLSEKCSGPNNKVPTGRTFRGRIERLQEKEVREALTRANDQVLLALKKRGVFRRRAVVAIDYTREPFYGDPDTKNVVGGKHERGTSWGYCYASIHVVEAGRRVTLYTLTVNQFTEKAHVVERLLNEAKARGVHVGLVLLDRAFFTVDVIAALRKLRYHFIMPAVKNGKVKQAIREHDEPARRFSLGEGDTSVRFNLFIFKRPKEMLPQKKKLSVYDLYSAFATNLPRTLASRLPSLISQEYRRRWGIETGYRIQRNVHAKTTSRKYLLRLLYQMTSVLVYNVWQYANLLLCRAMKTPFVKPVLKLTSLAVHFEGFIVGGLGPPRH